MQFWWPDTLQAYPSRRSHYSKGPPTLPQKLLHNLKGQEKDTQNSLQIVEADTICRHQNLRSTATWINSHCWHEEKKKVVNVKLKKQSNSYSQPRIHTQPGLFFGRYQNGGGGRKHGYTQGPCLVKVYHTQRGLGRFCDGIQEIMSHNWTLTPYHTQFSPNCYVTGSQPHPLHSSIFAFLYRTYPDTSPLSIHSKP